MLRPAWSAPLGHLVLCHLWVDPVVAHLPHCLQITKELCKLSVSATSTLWEWWKETGMHSPLS